MEKNTTIVSNFENNYHGLRVILNTVLIPLGLNNVMRVLRYVNNDVQLFSAITGTQQCESAATHVRISNVQNSRSYRYAIVLISDYAETWKTVVGGGSPMSFS